MRSNGKRRPTNGAAPPISQINTQRNGHHPLTEVLKSLPGPMSNWTVMGDTTDPFRLPTPKNHVIGAWVRDNLAMALAQKGTASIHDRGLHYAIVSVKGGVKVPVQIARTTPKGMAKIPPTPEGAPYQNLDDHWEWLIDAVKVSRWLGYVDWAAITDSRSARPDVILWTPPVPAPYVSVDFEVYIPDAEDLTPKAKIDGFLGSQVHHLVMIGEKASLKEILLPIAQANGADLYLPTGDMTDTMIYELIMDAIRDGRPMVVLYFSDCDPSGYHMPTILARKLHAHKAGQFPELPECEVHTVALTPEQVKSLNLPSTPIKVGDKRRFAWEAAWGIEQTEIDSLATLQPDVLRRLARAAVKPYFDRGLAARVAEVRNEWIEAAQAKIDEQAGGDLDQLRADAVAALAEKAAEIEAILDDVRVDAGQFDLPEVPEIPKAELDESKRLKPIWSSEWTTADQMLNLVKRKEYGA